MGDAGRSPQQSEVRRAGRDAADQDSARLKADTHPQGGRPHGTDRGSKGGGEGGGVPPAQQPPFPE